MSERILSDEFLSKYEQFPTHMNALARFVYLRTYSRFIDSLGRREGWKETVQRAVEYNVGLALKHYEANRIPYSREDFKLEAEELFDNIYNTNQFLSGRTLWIGGGDNQVAEKYPLANFNCSFLNITKWSDLCELFYLLLVGTGVGFKCTKEMARNLPKLRTDVAIIHSDYNPVPKDKRLERTSVKELDNGYIKIYIGDSKEGWVEALQAYLDILTLERYAGVHTVKFSYNSVRPAGERLCTFGGTASGHAPLREMFDGFDRVIKNKIDESLAPMEDGRARPIHILDMGNFIGHNVVVGGVRRTAEIFLFDADDWECILAKYGINGLWTEEQLEHHAKLGEALDWLGVKPAWFDDIKQIGDGRHNLHHRRMSNNSIAFTEKPEKETLSLVFELMKLEGEPGFVNLRELASRRFKQLHVENPSEELMQEMMAEIGMNPCAEIILASYGVCNLTTVNVMAFVKDGELDYEGLLKAQRLSARSGLRMTLAELEIEHWSNIQKRDRLLGTSLTGWKDAMGAVGYDENDEMYLLQDLAYVARDEANKYAAQLRVPTPLLVTTVKPEGTLSQVAGGVSSGLHVSHAPFYIRRIRINAHDPLAKAVQELGWVVSPEIDSVGETEEERFANARTLVVDFPVRSGAVYTREDQTVDEQFDTYFRFQKHYTEHNSSNTISVRPDEWKRAEQIVWDKWDTFAAVSFLAYSGGTYKLAPYEECTEAEYEALKAKMKPLTVDYLRRFENPEQETDIGDESCEGGACPIR